jgi:NADH dehydrogenase
MKVALIGGTGYVGSYICDELIANNYTPRVLVRKGSESKIISPEKCEIVEGDVSDETSIRELIKGSDAVIYLVAVIREYPKKGITNDKLQFRGSELAANIASELGVKRFLLMSALGATAEIDASNYQKAKHLSEQAVKNTNLDWTIVRPSSLFGDPRGNSRPEFCKALKEDMLEIIPKFPSSIPFPAPSFFEGLIPINSGVFSFSMIHVKDVAEVFVKLISDKKKFGKTVNLGGNEDFTWNDIIKTIAAASNKKVVMAPAPVSVVMIAATLLDWWGGFPVTRDQLKDLVKGSTCNSEDIFKKYQIDPIPFNKENLSYLAS